jgi:mRNA capping enzyme, beta chain
MPPELEPSFDNVVPYDDLTRTASDLIWDTIMRFPRDVEITPTDRFEIEAKLGTIIDVNTGERIHLPVDGEVAITEEFSRRTRFQSRMTIQQHQHLNKYLNAEVARSSAPPRVKIQYEHHYETDYFYELAGSDVAHMSVAAQYACQRNPHKTPRVRFTKDSKNGQVLAKIVKIRLGDRNFYCPKQAFDFRISVSLESAVPYDIDALQPSKEGPRVKDRLSYKHQSFCIDLTQVKTGGEKVHELEVELDTDDVLREAGKAEANVANQFEPMVTVFMNYIRALSRVDVIPRPLA